MWETRARWGRSRAETGWALESHRLAAAQPMRPTDYKEFAGHLPVRKKVTPKAASEAAAAALVFRTSSFTSPPAQKAW